MRHGFSALLAIAVVAGAILVHSPAAAEVDLGRPEQALGDELSYVGADGGVWLTQVGRGPTRLLLVHGEYQEYLWSPDGRRIAYVASDGGLGVLEIVSGRRQRLSGGPVEEVTWSPNGEQLAFIREQHLWSVAVRGGPATRLSDWSPQEDDRLGRLLWTDDGRYLIYQTSQTRGLRSISLLDIKANRTRTLALATSSGAMEAAAMSPDGLSLVVPHWQEGDSAEMACRRAGTSVAAAAVSPGDSGGVLAQVVELVGIPNLDRRAVTCWPLSETDAMSTGWLPPVFLRDGMLTLTTSLEAPAGLIVLDRAGALLDPRGLGFMSEAEERGRPERRYSSEAVANGSVAAVVYRSDVAQGDGLWFSVELHLVEPFGAGGPRRSIVLKDGCYCPGDRSDTNVTDLQLSPDGKQIAFTYFKNGVNRIGLVGESGAVTILADGERPIWRPSR